MLFILMSRRTSLFLRPQRLCYKVLFDMTLTDLAVYAFIPESGGQVEGGGTNGQVFPV